MTIHLVALLTGVSAGLRAMTTPAAMNWAAYLAWLKLQTIPVAFLASTVTPCSKTRPPSAPHYFWG